MALNFSVADTAVQTYARDGGIHITRYHMMEPALIRAVRAAGGSVYPGLPPVQTSIPIRSGQIPVSGTAESQVGGNNTKQTSARSATKMDLLVKAYEEYEQQTDQSLRAQLFGYGQQGYGARALAEKAPAVGAGFDVEHLGTLAGLASATDVEFVASASVATLSSALATYDETDYNADAMIVTRAGKRKFGLATNADGNLLFGGDLARNSPLDIPIFETEAKVADLGVSNLLAILGPFGDCAVGWSSDWIVKVFDQLESTLGGAAENIISILMGRYMGFVAPPTTVVPQSGWTIITDDA